MCEETPHIKEDVRVLETNYDKACENRGRRSRIPALLCIKQNPLLFCMNLFTSLNGLLQSAMICSALALWGDEAVFWNAMADEGLLLRTTLFYIFKNYSLYTINSIDGIAKKFSASSEVISSQTL